MKLVVVESPAKSRKIQQYLGKEYDVDSCVGHVRDLPQGKANVPAAIKGKPWADYAVDIDNGFKPYYVTIPGKDKILKALKAKLKKSDELILATDPDREGESISWHLLEALDPKVPVKRITFDEITKTAIAKAMKEPRDVDMALVAAQEARRILDRLYGYALSPLLWQKVRPKLSAGRVQSPAVRMVVERERERRAFRTSLYWDLVAHLEKGGAFDASLVRLAGKAIAQGRDFDPATGKLAAGKQVLVLEEQAAKDLRARLVSATWTVTRVLEEEKRRGPKAPFITSTLQQEANNRLNLSARDAMSVAQRLYEEGFITYMRTDSPQLSEEGLKGARSAVTAEFGSEYLSAQPKTYADKAPTGAQEAHEAIRPAGESFRHPDQTGLRGRELDLYRLIWRRTLASQMADERYTSTQVTLEALDAEFQASGKRVDFAGFRAAYDVEEDEEGSLPRLVKGDKPACTGVEAQKHETKPPARYTEAKLVEDLVKARIGRPSTYAAILETIKDRGYVEVRGKQLVPSFMAFAVTRLMEMHFPQLVDYDFTAAMEEQLDQVAAGKQASEPVLESFFLGPKGLQATISSRLKDIDGDDSRMTGIGGNGWFAKVGPFGAYVQAADTEPQVRATIPEAIAPADLDDATALALLVGKSEGPASLGDDPATGLPIYLKTGRFGPYVESGPEGALKRSSIPKGMDAASLSLDDASFLLSLPRHLGDHPQGGTVAAGLGRFGPYVVWKKEDKTAEYRSLKGADELRSTDLDGALTLLAQPKAARGRGARGAATVLRELGPHPKDGKPIQVLSGRYGPYVKHGDTNATVPRGEDPALLSIERAADLIAEREAKGPVKKKRGARRKA